MDELQRRTPESLTPGERAVMDQNWMAVNNDLDHLLDLERAHRTTGCTEWFCTGGELARALESFELFEVHLLLRGAMMRILKLEQDPKGAI